MKDLVLIGELSYRTPESSGATFRVRMDTEKLALIQKAAKIIKEIDAATIEFCDDVEVFSDSWIPQEGETLVGADSGCYEWGDQAEPWSEDLKVRTEACRLCVDGQYFWWSCDDWNDTDRYETAGIFIQDFLAVHV